MVHFELEHFSEIHAPCIIVFFRFFLGYPNLMINGGVAV